MGSDCWYFDYSCRLTETQDVAYHSKCIFPAPVLGLLVWRHFHFRNYLWRHYLEPLARTACRCSTRFQSSVLEAWLCSWSDVAIISGWILLNWALHLFYSKVKFYPAVITKTDVYFYNEEVWKDAEFYWLVSFWRTRELWLWKGSTVIYE